MLLLWDTSQIRNCFFQRYFKLHEPASHYLFRDVIDYVNVLHDGTSENSQSQLDCFGLGEFESEMFTLSCVCDSLLTDLVYKLRSFVV